MKTSYTKEQIEKILRDEKFEYHRVNLPYGLKTRGADKSDMADLVFPRSIAGKTVLDVGCASGFFCFEAEQRGASRVVGVELRNKRFRHAGMLKDILGSNVEFVQKDVVNDDMEEMFDYVCLLNVVHHLTEPVRVMRKLAQLTKEKLIIEFPTFADPRFRKDNSIRFPFLYNRLSLMGVNSMFGKKTGQTFIFTPSAIKRILLDHEKLFDKIDIIDSRVKGRKIAICRK